MAMHWDRKTEHLLLNQDIAWNLEMRALGLSNDDYPNIWSGDQHAISSSLPYNAPERPVQLLIDSNLPCCSELFKNTSKKKKESKKKEKPAMEKKPSFYISKYKLPVAPVKIIKNGPVVIVFWADKTKTIVRKKPGDLDDIYSAVAQALLKKMCGSTSHAHKEIDKLIIDKGGSVYDIS